MTLLMFPLCSRTTRIHISSTENPTAMRPCRKLRSSMNPGTQWSRCICSVYPSPGAYGLRHHWTGTRVSNGLTARRYFRSCSGVTWEGG